MSGNRFCCAVCPHQPTCEDVTEAVFARPEEVIADEADE